MKTTKKNPLTISKKDDYKHNLIPVHINMVKNEDYFYSWNSNNNCWMRGDKISEHYKRMSKNPMTESSGYK